MRVGPASNAWCPLKKAMRYSEEGPVVGQRMEYHCQKPRDTRNHQKQEKAKKDSSLQLRREHGPENTVISDFYSPEM